MIGDVIVEAGTVVFVAVGENSEGAGVAPITLAVRDHLVVDLDVNGTDVTIIKGIDDAYVAETVVRDCVKVFRVNGDVKVEVVAEGDKEGVEKEDAVFVEFSCVSISELSSSHLDT